MDIREDDEYILGEEPTDFKSNATGSVMRCFRKFFYAIIAIGLLALLVFQIILISSAVDVVAVKSAAAVESEVTDAIEDAVDAAADAIDDALNIDDSDVADQTEVTDEEPATVDDTTPVADPVTPAADPVTPAADTVTPVVADPAENTPEVSA